MGLLRGAITDSGYTESTIYKLLKPKKTGNDINGLGEANIRRPTPILWHTSKKIKHSAIQTYFYFRNMINKPADPTLFEDVVDMHRWEKTQRACVQHKKPSIQYHQHDRKIQFKESTINTREAWSTLLQQRADQFGAELVGVARLNIDWVFENYRLPSWVSQNDYKDISVVIIGVKMDYEKISEAPELPAASEAMSQYNRGAKIALQIGDWIHEEGWNAFGHCGPTSGEVLLVPHAVAAGLGELGKHGSLINDKYGASFRLACCITDLPLLETGSNEFGVDDFCNRCQVCFKACPPKAIKKDKVMVRGVHKWYVDFDKCIPYFVDNNGCGICLAVCPWSNPIHVDKIVQKQKKRLLKKTQAC